MVVSLNFRKRQAVSKAKQHNFQVLFSGLQTMKGTAVFRIDIAKKAERKNLEDILLFMDCIFDCHFAPPCGTASAARQMKTGPPPLRSVAHPMGFKHRLNRKRVSWQFFCKWTKDMIRRLDRAKIQLASTCNSDSFVELATGLVAFLFTLACLRRSGKRTLPFGHSMSFEPTLKGNMMACMNT